MRFRKCLTEPQSPSSCTEGSSLPRMPSPRFSCQSPDLKLRCATFAFQLALNFPPWDKSRDNEAEQGRHVVATKAEEAPLLGAVAHPEAAHVCAALQGKQLRTFHRQFRIGWTSVISLPSWVTYILWWTSSYPCPTQIQWGHIPNLTF